MVDVKKTAKRLSNFFHNLDFISHMCFNESVIVKKISF